jgi:hypothetical protein
MSSSSLADAIRQGCATTTMSRRAYAASNGHGGFSSVCAIGASALVAGALRPLGPTRYQLSFEALYAAFPELATPDVACPHCGKRATLHEVIVDLNDNHFWTREKVADWIEQQTLDFDGSPMPSGSNTCDGHESASMPVRSPSGAAVSRAPVPPVPSTPVLASIRIPSSIIESR